MQIKEFLDLVWSDQGHYCVVSKDQQENVTPIFLNLTPYALQTYLEYLECQELKTLKIYKTQKR